MARYVSRAQSFKKSVVKPTRTLATNPATGLPEVIDTGTPLIAIFQQGGATPREVEVALARFRFKGLAEGENPARRISVYDTDEQARFHGWPDELKEKVEAVLDAGQSADYFKVEKERAVRPWPAYDDAVAEAVVETAQVIGVPLEQVLAYETENKNRKTVVRQIEDALAEQADGVTVAA